jgi:non-heme chloroperoxidase
LIQAPQHATQRVVAPDGVTVAVQDWAVPGARRHDVLLLHGFSQSHQSWLKQVASPLAQEFRLVTYDLRGHGASDKPDDPLYYRDTARWAGEVNAVITATQLHRPVVVAWSYSGRILLDYLSHYGHQNVSGLVFANATTRTEPDVLGPSASLLRNMCDPDAAVNVPATRELLRACVALPLPAEELEYMVKYNLLVPAQVRAHLRRPPAQYDAVLQSLRLPALVIHGALDSINLPAMAAYTVSQIQGAQLKMYEDVAHMPFWESPQRFNADVSEFFRRAFT